MPHQKDGSDVRAKHQLGPDEAWLAQVDEPVLYPELPVIDPHHHLWSRPYSYAAVDLLRDLQSGHRVLATVYTQASQSYRTDGPEHLRPVGETDRVTVVAEMSDRAGNAPRICAGITGGGDLTAGAAKVEELLEAHIAAGRGRFRGIRSYLLSFEPGTLAMSPAPGWKDAA